MNQDSHPERDDRWSFLEPDRESVERVTRAALAAGRGARPNLGWRRPALALLFVVPIVAGAVAARQGWRQSAWPIGLASVEQVLGSQDRERQDTTSHVSAVPAYDDFMRLTPTERRRVFWQELDSERRAEFARAHANRWLQANRARLDASELSGMQSFVNFISPRLYRDRPDEAATKSEIEFSRSLHCVVNPDDVRAAFDVFDEASQTGVATSWGYFARARCWVGRLADSAIDCAELRVCRL